MQLGLDGHPFVGGGSCPPFGRPTGAFGLLSFLCSLQAFSRGPCHRFFVCGALFGAGNCLALIEERCPLPVVGLQGGLAVGGQLRQRFASALDFLLKGSSLGQTAVMCFGKLGFQTLPFGKQPGQLSRGLLTGSGACRKGIFGLLPPTGLGQRFGLGLLTGALRVVQRSLGNQPLLGQSGGLTLDDGTLGSELPGFFLDIARCLDGGECGSILGDLGRGGGEDAAVLLGPGFDLTTAGEQRGNLLLGTHAALAGIGQGLLLHLAALGQRQRLALGGDAGKYRRFQ